MTSAFDTLCSQAYGDCLAGRSSKEAVGRHLMPGMVILMLLCIPITLVWWFAETILIAAGQDPQIAALSGLFVRYPTFSFFIYLGVPLLQYPFFISLGFPQSPCCYEHTCCFLFLHRKSPWSHKYAFYFLFFLFVKVHVPRADPLRHLREL
jgi:hypothetical protein